MIKTRLFYIERICEQARLMFHTEVVIMATVTMPHLTGADIAHNSHIGKAMLSVQCAIPYDDIYQYIIWREISNTMLFGAKY